MLKNIEFNFKQEESFYNALPSSNQRIKVLSSELLNAEIGTHATRAVAEKVKLANFKEIVRIISKDLINEFKAVKYCKESNKKFNSVFSGSNKGTSHEYIKYIKDGYSLNKEQILEQLEIQGISLAGVKLPDVNSFIKPIRHAVKCVVFNFCKVEAIEDMTLTVHKSKDKRFNIPAIQRKVVNVQTSTGNASTADNVNNNKSKIVIGEILAEEVNKAYSGSLSYALTQIKDNNVKDCIAHAQSVLEVLASELNIKLVDNLDMKLQPIPQDANAHFNTIKAAA